ncbi:hypothetical protein [Kiritimatiella glycovorans]|uniref:Transposase n=1 Tax=Kiritimatiella glycovorans TaxID=1307763 RepID=A0A0G3EFE3_9BACT|nr:hypothetical protein [Kiritimatiella glycovorans]AKJ65058.1 hypothetical protein L21SP4_01821 [Kiritimatiella glycovorans]
MDERTVRIIRESRPQDYDGHTGFREMTPDQRLHWLEEANETFRALHGLVERRRTDRKPHVHRKGRR